MLRKYTGVKSTIGQLWGVVMQQACRDYKTQLLYLFILDVVRHILDEEITNVEAQYV